MSSDPKRPRAVVLSMANGLVKLLAPSCVRIEIAGSLRRERPQVGDIELVAIPRIDRVTTEGDADLFGMKSPQTKDVNRLWEQLDIVAGRSYTKHGDKYRQFLVDVNGEKPIKVDLFTATAANWGLIYLIRTGSAEFSHYVLMKLNDAGYCCKDGFVHHGELHLIEDKWKLRATGNPLSTPTEQEVFDLAKVANREPRVREGSAPPGNKYRRTS